MESLAQSGTQTLKTVSRLYDCLLFFLLSFKLVLSKEIPKPFNVPEFLKQSHRNLLLLPTAFYLFFSLFKTHNTRLEIYKQKSASEYLLN